MIDHSLAVYSTCSGHNPEVLHNHLSLTEQDEDCPCSHHQKLTPEFRKWHRQVLVADSLKRLPGRIARLQERVEQILQNTNQVL